MTTQTVSDWATLPRPHDSTLLTALAVVLLWLATIILVANLGHFNVPAGTPPLITLTALAGPPLLFFLLMQVKSIRSEILKVNPVWITAMQGLRILGGGFLFVYAFGHLPALFAFMAGYGDMIVAFLAPIMTAKLAINRGFLKSNALKYFHYLGLLDFVGAVGSGLIARGTIPLLANPESTTALGQLPLALIPCFAVPLWICLHMVALMQIKEAHNQHPNQKNEQNNPA